MEQQGPIGHGDFKVGDTVWFLDTRGRACWGTLSAFKMGTKQGLCALVNDSVTRQMVALRPEQLMSSPPKDAPRARQPAGRGKKR